MNWYKIAVEFDPEDSLYSDDSIVNEILLFTDYMKQWDEREFIEKQDELNIFIARITKLESSEDIKLFLDEAPKLSDAQIKKLVLAIIRKTFFDTNSVRSPEWRDIVYYLKYFATEDADFIKQVVEAAVGAKDGTSAYQLLMFAPDVMGNFKDKLLAKIIQDKSLINLANIAIYGMKKTQWDIISKSDFEKIQDVLIQSGDLAILEYFVRESPYADKAKIAKKYLDSRPDYYSLLSFITSVKKAYTFGGDFNVLSDIIEKGGLYLSSVTNQSHEARRLLEYLTYFSYNLSQEVKMQILKKIAGSVNGDADLINKLLYLVSYDPPGILSLTEKQQKDLLDIIGASSIK